MPLHANETTQLTRAAHHTIVRLAMSFLSISRGASVIGRTMPGALAAITEIPWLLTI
jgi:hypothetical protein